MNLRESAEDVIDKPAFVWVHCLALDMRGGTDFGLALSQEQYRVWISALVKQMDQHWKALDLNDARSKFEGDGWLVFTPETRLVKELCCLGLVMVRCFQDDMARLTGIDRKTIPPLRAAINGGMDLDLSLPDGGRDWSGDSARRAVRASGYCDGATVLVSESVKQMVLRDFELHPFDRGLATHAPKRDEEPEPLYELMGLRKTVAALDATLLPSYVYVLRKFGRSEDMVEAASQLLAAVDAGAAPESREQSAAVRGVANLGTLDGKALRGIVISPQVRTFNIAIGAAVDYSTALHWFERLKAAGVSPNVFTFSTLVARAPDYSTALQWFERLKAAGVSPDVVTFNTLVARAPDYSTALQWFERMEAAGVSPDVVTFNTLFAKPLYDHAPQAIIDWYLRREYHPDGPIGALLTNLKSSGDLDGMAVVLLRYPHLPAGRKIFLKWQDEILDRLLAAYAAAPNEPNPPYAVGVCLVELGRTSDAIPYLKHALKLARAGARKNHLRQLLRQITQ